MKLGQDSFRLFIPRASIGEDLFSPLMNIALACRKTHGFVGYYYYGDKLYDIMVP